MTTTPREKKLIEAAHDYDVAHRPLGSWTRVPDEQVLRLLTGARLMQNADCTRPCTAGDQIRWAWGYIREHYGPASGKGPV